MEHSNSMEERLWQYIDGNVSGEERDRIGELVQQDAAWKEKYRELLEWQTLLRSSELASPSLRFTKNVMEQLASVPVARAARNYINKKIIWSIGIFFIALIAGALIYAFGEAASAGNGEAGTIGRQLNRFDYSKIFSNTLVNVFILLNAFIGLFLLDMYLGKRRRMYREQHH